MQLTRRGAAPLVALSALTALALAGCNHSDTTSSTGGVVATVAGAPAGTVATVTTPKGGMLTLSQPAFFAQLQSYVPGSNPNPQAARLPTGQAVMQQLVQGLMFEGLAQDQGLAPTDAEVDAQYNNIKLVQEIRNVKPFDQVLADNGLTPEIVKETQIKPLLSQVKLLTKGVTITDADIKTYYDANKNKSVTNNGFTKPERVHIRKIAVATQAEADAIAADVKSGKSTFDKEVPKSLDKSTPDGDFPTWIAIDPAAPGSEVLTKPLAATAEGGLTTPIPIPGPSGPTFWLVQVVKKEKKEVMPLDQVKDLVRAVLLQQKAGQNSEGQQALQQQLRDFQTASKVVIAGPQYAALAQEITHPAPPPPPAPAGGPAGGPGGSTFAPAPGPR